LQRIDYIVNLLKEHLAGDLDSSQVEALKHLFSEYPYLKDIVQEVDSEVGLRRALSSYEELYTDEFLAREEEVLSDVLSRIRGQRPHSKKHLWKRRLAIYASVAATALIVLFTAVFIQRQVIEPQSTEETIRSFMPGSNKASLKLSNGQKIDLSDAYSGIIVDGDVTYEDGSAVLDENNIDAQTMLTLSTPRGGQYQITLPDGTKVWLNAESKLHYPYHFSLDARRVKLDGEAYFEVAHHKNRPFIVDTEKEKVEVLGTHFNVNSYKADINTTVALLEGKVKVSLKEGATTVLKPGQQSVVTNGKMEIQTINVDESIAWKNGEFMFNNESLENAMKKVARWYDLEIEVSPKLQDVEIWGSVSRYDNFNTVLKLIKMTDSRIRFLVEGRRVRLVQ
jgi:transmembrane sensor